MRVNKLRQALICFIAVLILSVYGFINIAIGQDNAEITITVKENQNIRDISGEYLHDPDLWVDILRANDLKSPHEVRPGMVLHIPAEAISRANKELENSLELIHQATGAGAKIFAPEIIAEAIYLRDNSLEKRKSGDWVACASLAGSAADKAKKALKISEANQDVPAKAVVQHRQGQVHSRKPSDNLWNDVSLYEILLEGDRIRTLSQSYADILFRDDSRLQLKENAQALIQKMRANLLEDTQEANVSLVEGDVLALLAAGKKASRFRLEVPGVDTKINSRRFWVSRDDQGARFANYDGELGISSAGAEVVLKENQGSVVPLNQKPSAPQKLLTRPQLLKPENGAELFDINMVLAWNKVEGAEHYLLEFAGNGSFSKIIWSEVVRSAEQRFPQKLGRGSFYWRVAAVSSDRLPGRYSIVRFFRVMDDDKPPFLVIRTPEERALLSESSVLLSGVTEDGISLTIQEQPVEVADGGTFQFQYALSEGENIIILKATDLAGNITVMKRTVIRLSESAIELTFDPSLPKIAHNHFLVGNRSFTLFGKTIPQGVVTVRTLVDTSSALTGAGIASGRQGSGTLQPAVTTVADDTGRFQINLKLIRAKDEFTIEVASRTGLIRNDRFWVEIDNEPPIISFIEEIPTATGQKTLPLAGMIEGGISLDLNGLSVALTKAQSSKLKAFQLPFELKPGMNHLHFEARDRVDNVAVIEKEVFFDPDAPRLVNHELSLQKAQGGEEASVVVWAEDATGFVKAAPFTVQIGEYSLTGYMILSGSKGKYTGLFRVPENVSGTIKLKAVTLSDYLGNSKEYGF